MRRFADSTAGKILIAIGELILIAAIVWAVIYTLESVGVAEETTAYAICTPGNHVNIRSHPNTRGEPIGWLDPGDSVCLDGKRKNGYLHCVGLGIEAGEGWVHKGYLVNESPVPVNRDATVVSRTKLKARKNIDGKRMRWLKPGGTVTVYYMAGEWAVTNCGYVQSRYLELDGE